MTVRLLILAVLAIAALFWARVVYGLIFRDNGARPGDPSWICPNCRQPMKMRKVTFSGVSWRELERVDAV